MKIYSSYIFGRLEDKKFLTVDDVRDIFNEAKTKKEDFFRVDTSYIIEILDKAGNIFKDKKSKYYRTACNHLASTIKFSVPMMEKTLDIVPEILNRKELVKRMSLEMIYPYAVDNILERHNYDGFIRAYPKGVVLHVAAGNVFLGILDSFITGFLTKNINVIKLSSSGSNFMTLFASLLKELDYRKLLYDKFAILSWEGGRKDIESEAVKHVDMVAVWGGYDAVDSYRKLVPFNVDVEGFGPKTSFGILFDDYIKDGNMDEIAKAIVKDCAMWDQSACSNMHTLYIVGEKEDKKKIEKLLEALKIEFVRFNRMLPIGKLSDDEKVEITKARELARVDEALNKAVLISSFPDPSYTVIYEKDSSYRISPLNRVLYVKHVKNLDSLKKEILPYREYIQTVGIGGNIFQRKEVLNTFYTAGAMRFTKLGEMTEGKTGSPHDGRFVMSRFVNWVGLEGRRDRFDKLFEIVNYAKEKSKFYKKHYSKFKSKILRYDEFIKLPLLEKNHVLNNTPPESTDLLTSKPVRGIYFASGGSTGQPKYVFYDQHEYEHTVRMLAYAYEAAGLSEKDVIANLFVAGNLWSSWLSVEKAIAYTKAVSVPIGSNLPVENIVSYLKQFDVTAIIGLPSFLVKLAEYVDRNNIKLKINKVFYGGEYVGDEMVKYFKKVFNNADVKSAGYATADAGVIGFQCRHTSKGVHHLFAWSQFIEFLNPDTGKPVKDGEIGELVVTSLNKKKMPIIRYRVGDLGRWILKKCECGRTEPLFEILGRCDDRIHAGGAHIFVNDIQNAIGKVKELSFNFQIIIYKKKNRDYLEIIVEYKKNVKDFRNVIKRLQDEILKNCEDLRESINMGLIDMPDIKIVPPNTIERIKRTGKIKRVVDKRIKNL